MVDVSHKQVTHRLARASAQVVLQPNTLQSILEDKIEKGNVLAVARVAGIMAAKQCPALIPLCHPLPLASVSVDIQPHVEENMLVIIATVKTTAQTGVEMEALTAVSVAALTVYDMCKPIDKGISIEKIMLLEKEGGKSGMWARQVPS
jgi:cyclic pyranopterin phosphate synthase